MDSWAGYAAVSYGQRMDSFQAYCGQAASLHQAAGLHPAASLQPTYDPVFPALLHQKAAYGRSDPEDWPRHHPFGVLPHEAAAAAFPFPPQNHPLNPHQVGTRRSSPTHDVSPSFFQTNFPAADPLQKIDYPSRLYQNLQQTTDSPLKDYRPYQRQDCDRLYDKIEPTLKKTMENDSLTRLYPNLQQQIEPLTKDYRFQSDLRTDQIESAKKTFDNSDPREYSQSSPISFAMMDQRMRSPQFQSSFRYTVSSTPDDFQRSKSSESFSSSSGSECSQRPSPVQQNSTAPFPYNNHLNDCYKEPAVETLQKYPLSYSSVVSRDNRPVENINRFDDFNRQNWDDKRKYSYENIQRAPHFDNNQNNCRGDPMNLVRNLHNTPEKVSEDKRRSDRVVDELLREPPPAHNQSTNQNNYNFDFDRWNLTATGSKILTQVSFNQNRLGNVLPGNDRPQSLVLPGAVPYFPTLQIQQQEEQSQSIEIDLEKNTSKAPRLKIEEELVFLSTEKPIKIKFIPKVDRKSCVEVYQKFIRGSKAESPPKMIRKASVWSKPCSLPRTSEFHLDSVKEYPSDPQDDPRYFPLPKSSEMRCFDSSDDSSDDSFCSSVVRKIRDEKVSSPSTSMGKKCACKSSSSLKKKKTARGERSISSTTNKCNNVNLSPSPQSRMITNSDVMTVNNGTGCPTINSESLIGRINNPLGIITKQDSLSDNKGNKIIICSNGSKVQQNIHQISRIVKRCKNSQSVVSFKVDDFIVLKLDQDETYPPIWRVKEKNILQKFQHFVKDGVDLYIGLPSVVAWSSQDNSLYHPVPVSVTFINKSSASNIVQVLDYPFQLNRTEKQFTESYLKDMAHLQDSFEVFLQTLFSQALDSNFLQEIYDEKDEYFLARVREVEAVVNGLRARLSSVLGWSAVSLEAVSRWPSYRLAPAPRSPRTCVCTKYPAASLLGLHGNMYHPQTLHRIPSTNSAINKELPVCRFCVKYFQFLHTASHQKLGLFICCEERVSKARDPAKDTTSLLNHLLADQPFLNKLFREVRLTWARIERCLKENKFEAKVS